MKSFDTITLFTSSALSHGRLNSFGLSAVLHGVTISALVYGVFLVPRLIDPHFTQRNFIRTIYFQRTEQQPRAMSASSLMYASSQTSDDVEGSSLQEIMQKIAYMNEDQTLIDVQQRVIPLKEIPVPDLQLWSAGEISPKIVPNHQIDISAPDVSASVDPPNRSMTIAEMSITPTNFVAEKTAVKPSSTALIVQNSEVQKLKAEEASALTEPPTQAMVMARSDVHRVDDAVVLPAASQAPSAKQASIQGSGKSDEHGQTDGGKSAGKTASDTSPTIATATNSAEKKPMQAPESGYGNDVSVEHVALSKNGQFGLIVVGSSLEDEYPEMAGVWKGRVAYTASLSAGFEKSWIFQYSLPLSAEAGEQESHSRMKAPWPYDIFRPISSAADLNADPIMLHGFVNQDGRFEGLSIIFPGYFPAAAALLRTLQQWQFRPATQNERNVRVEILLVIPSQS